MWGAILDILAVIAIGTGSATGIMGFAYGNARLARIGVKLAGIGVMLLVFGWQ